MACGVDLAHPPVAHVGVDRRGIEAGVAEQLLDHPQVGPAVQHMSRAGVAQQVAAALGIHADGIEVAAHEVPKRPGAEAVTVTGEE